MQKSANSTTDNGTDKTDTPRFQKLRRVFGAVWPHVHWLLPLAGAVLAVAHTHVLLGGGENRSGDNMFHVLNEYAILTAILGGDNPLGPVGMEYGMPILRFYQALYYLWNVAATLVTGIDLMVMHNVTVVLCFALSPFSYLYFLRKIGLNRFQAGLGSFASMISIASFGNSIEAYHQAGIVTQSMGGFFFPWFMGHFIGMLRGENRASSTAVLFAISCVSHAIMTVFAAFTSALYILTLSKHITRQGLKKLVLFGVLGAMLASFWLLPFVDHTNRMRPIPDSVVRGAGLHWFTSVSKNELTMVLFTGRLLDDPPRKGDDRDSNDELMDNISIIHALSTRFPAVTVLTGLGFLIALFTIRRPGRRFLLTGFVFSLFLFAGPDDYPWQWHLPFMKNIQSFRCTYLVEFFAFGLVGMGVEVVLRRVLQLILLVPFRLLRWPLIGAWATGLGFLLVLNGEEILILGDTHLGTRDTRSMDAMIDALGTLHHRGRPYRISAKYAGRSNLRDGWFAKFGLLPYCTHWKGVGPTAAWHLCGRFGMPDKFGDLNALVGNRYYSGSGEEIAPYLDATDSDGFPAFQLLPNARDRRGNSNDWHKLVDTGRDHFLRPLVGEPFPVVCSHAQWVWLSKEWIMRYRNTLWSEDTPIAMRVASGKLADSGLLESAQTVLYLDHSGVDKDRQALAAFATEGGMVLSPTPVTGLDTIRPTPGDKKPFWEMLPNRPRPSKISAKDHREEIDPGFDRVQVAYHDTNWRSLQSFTFDVDVLEPTVAVLPMEAVPGWTASLDGKPLETFAAGPDMLSVYLPKGAHRLVFAWRMDFIGWFSLLLTYLALAVVLGIWGHAAWTRLRRGSSTL